MFEVGQSYTFVTLMRSEDGLEEIQQVWTVKAVNDNLLDLHTPAGQADSLQVLNDAGAVEAEYLGGPTPEQNMVLNTSSAFFHSAVPVVEE
ncbi:MAG: hypothetical protein LC676_18800 [Loktanella sp.]|nr:hypothetical protein [Loktanella sp.]